MTPSEHITTTVANRSDVQRAIRSNAQPLLVHTGRTRLAAYCVGLLALVGILFPSSINGIISWELGFAQRALTLLLAAALFVASPYWKNFLKNNVYICPTLLVFTWLSPLPGHAYGLLMLYATLALILSTDFGAIPQSTILKCAWQVINYGSLAFAFALIVKYAVADRFIVNNYSVFYDWLVEGSVDAGKPVLTFGSHSLAGFFFAMFCALNCIRARATRAMQPALLALLDLAACAMLRSVTGFMVLLVFLVVFFSSLQRTWRKPFLLGVSLVGFSFLLFNHVAILDAAHVMTEVFSSDANGFLGRYSSHGRAAPMLDYIARNPFRPSGLAYTDEVWVGDSGFLEYWCRGSVVLLALMYRGLWLCLRRAVPGRSARLYVFAMFLMFEFGYTTLVYPRMLGFMPLFFIVFRASQLKRFESLWERAGVLRRVRLVTEVKAVPCLQ